MVYDRGEEGLKAFARMTCWITVPAEVAVAEGVPLVPSARPRALEHLHLLDQGATRVVLVNGKE
eukprot:238745-Alexandrium_andersonii.AAC.1